MNTHPRPTSHYGDWRDMTVEELRDWLHLQVTSWWRHVTLMDLYDDPLRPERKRRHGARVDVSP
jgi:hypothetical protein